MAIFKYKGILQNGKEFKSSITADNITQAKQKVQSTGVMLIDIKEENSNSKKGLSFGIKGKVNIAQLSLMTRQLSTLIKAKIPIAESLNALTEQIDTPVLKIVLSEVKKKINEGASLASALADYPHIFDNVYVNMVSAGEASGNLDLVLLRLAEFTESQMKLKNKINSAMLYPAIMGLAGSGMMTFIFVAIIPKIAKVFESMKRELPLATRLCINISYFLTNYWYTLVFIFPILIYLFRKYLKTTSGESNFHRFQLKFPILNELVIMINVGRFCSTLATLLNSGVPILTALSIVRNLIVNVHVKVIVDEAKVNVKEGGSIATPLINSGLFPPLVTQMISLGEKSGELEDMLEIVADNYQDQVNNKLNGLTAILEPIMMLFLGGAVAFIVMAVVIPMMSLYSSR